MSDKIWALLGNWCFVREKPKGLSIYRCDEGTGTLAFQETVLDHLYIGHQCYDAARDIDYVVNETDQRPGQLGGGGSVAAIRFDRETGKAALINERDSLASEPSCLCMDRFGRYLIVVHHVSSGHVTKIRFEDGQYRSVTLTDDAAVVLFEIAEDGSVGRACDIYIVEGSGDDGIHALPHLQCVVPNPSGSLYCVCDSGCDRIYLFAVDAKRGKLRLVNTVAAPDGTGPRYGVFHPFLPVLYISFEKSTEVYTFRYRAEDGSMEPAGSLQMLPDPKSAEGMKWAEAPDILINDDGSRLYVCIRGVNIICVLSADAQGRLEVLQNVRCLGDPMGMAFSRNGQFLYSSNMKTGTISTFKVNDDGTLRLLDSDAKGVSPANMVIVGP